MRATIGLILCGLGVVQAHAQFPDAHRQPQGIPAMPGQYDGFLDWVAQQEFTADGIPAGVSNAWWQCVYPASYRLMDSFEQHTIDSATQTDGMTPVEEKIFFQRFIDRIGGSGKYWVAMTRSCRAEFHDYWSLLMTLHPELRGD